MRLLLLTLLFVLSLAIVAAERPNILFIITDDQSLHTIATFGTGDTNTPHIDRLARSGTSFVNAYNMGSWHNAVCIASRGMLMSGQYLWDAQHIAKKSYPHPSITSLFRDAGYRLYGTGKWHVVDGLGMKRHFDFTLDERPGELKLSKEDRSGFTPWNKEFGGYWEGERHVTDITGDSAVTLIEQATAQDDPFFVYVGFNAPHTTFQYAEADIEHFSPSHFTLPPSIKSEHFFLKNRWPKTITPEFVQGRYQSYFAMVERLDHQVGRIIAALKHSGKYEDTIIAFLSDHGMNQGENGIMGKQNCYEVSSKAPLILAGPGVPENERRKTAVYLQDVMPTLLEKCRIERPEFINYRSLVPVIADDSAPHHEGIYSAFKDTMRSIRIGDYKLMLFADDEAAHARLFHLKSDPHEMRDLSQLPEHEEKVSKLYEALKAWEKKAGSSLDLDARFRNRISSF